MEQLPACASIAEWKDTTSLMGSTFGDWVRESRKAAGLTQAALAEKVGISRTQIIRIESGDQGTEPFRVRQIAQSTNADPNEGLRRLSTRGTPDALAAIGPDIDPSVLQRVPFIPGLASASMDNVGEGGHATGTARSILPNNVRAIEVHGDSMEPKYHSGDVLFVQETNQAHDGDTVVATIGLDGVTCKVYRNPSGEPPSGYLEPYNGEGRIAWPRFSIAGIVIGYFRRERRQ